MVGGFLVTASVVGLVAVEAGRASEPSSYYVVVSGDDVLPAGHVLAPRDVEARRLRLPPSVAGRAHREEAAVVGRVLVANIAPGELLQRSSLAPRGPRPGELEVSFSVDPTRALGVRIETGDVVDVFLTTGEGAQASTTLVLRGIRVIDKQVGGSSSPPTFTVGLPSEDSVRALLTATASGAVSLVRATSAVS